MKRLHQKHEKIRCLVHSAVAGGRTSSTFTRRQSSPTNSASNRAWFSAMIPSVMAGQVKLASSSLLQAITKPVPSQNKNLNRSARRGRTKKTMLVNGSLRSTDGHQSAQSIMILAEVDGFRCQNDPNPVGREDRGAELFKIGKGQAQSCARFGHASGHEQRFCSRHRSDWQGQPFPKAYSPT